MRTLLFSVVAGLALLPRPAAGRQAPGAADPSVATVLIRVIGDVEAETPADRVPVGERRYRKTDVQIATGSGFLITSVGHILTCAHVVRDSVETVVVDGARVNLKLAVRRIEIVLPSPGSGDQQGRASAPYEATVLAADSDLDLALLSISGSLLPYLRLGDSDALEAGDPLVAFGYPFGEAVEIGRPAGTNAPPPDPSVSRGNVSAFRADGQGRRRYVQTTAAISAGSSGGPVLDADGYVTGIVSRMLVGRAGAGSALPFAIAVNVAKDFLEARSQDALLGVRRLTADVPRAIPDKGMAVAFPYGMSDESPIRARVEASGATKDDVVLRIDRVLSPWTPIRLAEALTSERAFERFVATTTPVQRSVDAGRRRALVGHVSGSIDQVPVRMEFAILDLGVEKLVARFIGPPDQVAFNASVLRTSLKALEGTPLRTARPGLTGWSPLGGDGPLARVQVPRGWLVQTAAPVACAGLPFPVAAASASPAEDFAIAFSVAWLRGTQAGPRQAASACGTPAPGEAGGYERQIDWLGTRFVLAGGFVERAPGELVQYEAMVPADQLAAVRPLIDQWLAKVVGSR